MRATVVGARERKTRLGRYLNRVRRGDTISRNGSVNRGLVQLDAGLRFISIEVVQGDPQGFRGGGLAAVIGREQYGWLALAEELSAG